MSDSSFLKTQGEDFEVTIPVLPNQLNDSRKGEQDQNYVKPAKQSLVGEQKSMICNGDSRHGNDRLVDDMTQGVPKTSRFQKVTDSCVTTTPGHTYNPYLYTQHKIRPNAPFDQFQINTTTVELGAEIIEDEIVNNIHYTVAEGSIPTVKITGKDMAVPDPYELYTLMEPLGKKYGAILLDFSDCEDSIFQDFDLNTENFWFRPRKQHVGSFKSHSTRKLDFHYKLYQYHKSKAGSKDGSSLAKIPSIDKRTLDLYRLWTCVRLRGGFKSVCQKKLWAQIGRELGYSGRIMSSLSTSLRSAYLKIFSENDEFENYFYSLGYDSFFRALNSEHSEEVKKEDTGPKVVIQTNKRPFDDLSPIEDIPVNNKRACKQSNNPIEFYASNKEYIRMRDVLKTKGFETSYESLFEPKGKVNMIEDPNTFGFNFGLCQSFGEIYDKSMHESKTSPIYNLKQYNEKAQSMNDRIKEFYCNQFAFLQNSGTWRIEDFENLYNKALESEDIPFDIDTALELSSLIHGSGFATAKKSTVNGKDVVNKWNLNNVNNHNESLLKYMDVDYGALGSSKIDIGMILSTTGWSYEDSALPLLDYSHMGSSKIWYIISPDSQHKFEALLEKLHSAKISSQKEMEEPSFGDPQFERSEIFQCFKQSNIDREIKTYRKRTNTHSLLNISDASNGDKSLPNNIQIPTKLLREAQIKFFSVVQNPKTFILKYPEVYTSTISSGFNISEKSLFAPKEWLKYIIPSAEWSRSRQIIPSIMPFQFLMNIINDSDMQNLREHARTLIQPLLKKELYLRKLVADFIPRKQNKFDFISDLDLSNTGASKIIVADDNDCLTFSISQFLDNREHFKGKTDLLIELHEYYPTESLVLLSDSIDVSSDLGVSLTPPFEENKDILEEIKELALLKYKNKRVPISELKMLVLNHKTKNTSSSTGLRAFLSEITLVIRKCREVLEKVTEPSGHEYDFGRGFNLKMPPLPANRVKITELLSIKKTIDGLIVDFEEVKDIQNLVLRFNKFQQEAHEVIESDDFEEIFRVYKNGISLRVDSRYLGLLRLKLGRMKWSQVYDSIFTCKTAPWVDDWKEYTLERLYSYLCIGADLFGDQKIKELEVVANALKQYQSILFRLYELAESKTSSFVIKDLEELGTELEKFIIPIEPRWRKGLKQLITPIRQTKDMLSSIQPKLSSNEALIMEMENLLRSGSKNAFSLMGNFDGSSEDHRLSQVDAQRQLPPIIYSHHLKKCKSWLQDLNKFIGNAKTNLTSFSERICHALDLESDTFKSVLERKNSNYCFCRQGDLGGVMVQCELCQEWYHASCVAKGKWKSLPEDESTVFCCQLCLHKDTNFNAELLSYHFLLQLSIDSLRLTIVPDKQILQKLFRILRTCLLFLQACSEYLENTALSINAAHTPGPNFTYPQYSKFLLRKIVGSGIEFPSLKTRLALISSKGDKERVCALIMQNKTIVTGHHLENNEAGTTSSTTRESTARHH